MQVTADRTFATATYLDSATGLIKFMNLSCTLRLNNVFDEDYAYVPLYPMPPRNFNVSIKWEFWD